MAVFDLLDQTGDEVILTQKANAGVISLSQIPLSSKLALLSECFESDHEAVSALESVFDYRSQALTQEFLESNLALA